MPDSTRIVNAPVPPPSSHTDALTRANRQPETRRANEASSASAPSFAELLRTRQGIASGDTSLPISISADGKTPHQAVITAMDAAGKLGFSHLRMTTVEAPTAN